LNEVWIINNV